MNEEQGTRNITELVKLSKIITHDIRVKSIQLEGLVKLKQDVVVPFLKPVLAARSLSGVVTQLNTALDGLRKLEAIDSYSVEVNKGISHTTDAQEVTLKLMVQEARSLTIGANLNSDAGLNDGSFVAHTKLRNLFGRCESLRADYVKGTNVKHGFNLTFDKPVMSQRGSAVKAVLSKEDLSSRVGGYMTSNLKSFLLYNRRFLGGNNEFEVGGLWQQIHGGTNVNMKIREEFGHHLKCAIKHRYTHDTRDHPVIPTRGTRLHLETELAGFMGDVNHLKCTLESALHVPLVLGYTGTVALRGGLVKNLAEQGNTHTWVTDKFYCGGPGSVRGFFADGIGRPMGGLMHWGAGLSLTRKLPFSPHIWGLGQFMRLHHFVNAGSLGNCREDLAREPRVSVGSGVIINVANTMRMEINYALPLRHSPNDVLNHGLQFGIGVNFM